MERVKKSRTFLLIFAFLPFIFGVSAADAGIPVTPGSVSAADADIPATDMETAVKRRDPFKSPLFVSKAATSKVPASPLLKYALSEFKLVGIIWGDLGSSAVVEAPDGKCYVIKKGEEIGKLRGKITKIAKEKVVVQNAVTDYLGKTQNQEIDMKLYKEEEIIQ